MFMHDFCKEKRKEKEFCPIGKRAYIINQILINHSWVGGLIGTPALRPHLGRGNRNE